MLRFWIQCAAVLLMTSLPAVCQYYPGGYPGGGYPSGPYRPPSTHPGGGRQAKPGGDTAGMPTPTFTGVVRGSDSKGLTITDAESNAIEFNCSRKTSYFSGKDKIKASAIKPGDSVSVEARKAPDGTLDAVAVRLESNKKKAAAPPES